MESGVELRDLRVFLTLAEELHFGRAADRLHISRSRVSQVVATMEARLGARLFDRTSRRVGLTPVGEQLRRDVEPHYQQLQRALERAAAVSALRIGIYTPFCMGRHVTEIVGVFRSHHPETEVVFVNAASGPGYLDWLRSGAVDMLAARLPVDATDLVVGPVISCEQWMLMVFRQDALAERQSLQTADYAGRTLVDAVDVPRESADAFGAVMRVASGSHAYLTTARVAELYSHPDVVGVPIEDREPLETALVWSAREASSRTMSFAATAAAVVEAA